MQAGSTEEEEVNQQRMAVMVRWMVLREELFSCT